MPFKNNVYTNQQYLAKAQIDSYVPMLKSEGHSFLLDQANIQTIFRIDMYRSHSVVDYLMDADYMIETYLQPNQQKKRRKSNKKKKGK